MVNEIEQDAEQPEAGEMTVGTLTARLHEAFDAEAAPADDPDAVKRGIPWRLVEYEDPKEPHPVILARLDPRESQAPWARQQLLAPIFALNPRVADFISDCADRRNELKRTLTTEDLAEITAAYGWSADYGRRLRAACRRVMLARFSPHPARPADVQYIQRAGTRPGPLPATDPPWTVVHLDCAENT